MDRKSERIDFRCSASALAILDSYCTHCGVTRSFVLQQAIALLGTTRDAKHVVSIGNIPLSDLANTIRADAISKLHREVTASKLREKYFMERAKKVVARLCRSGASKESVMDILDCFKMEASTLRDKKAQEEFQEYYQKISTMPDRTMKMLREKEIGDIQNAD